MTNPRFSSILQLAPTKAANRSILSLFLGSTVLCATSSIVVAQEIILRNIADIDEGGLVGDDFREWVTGRSILYSSVDGKVLTGTAEFSDTTQAFRYELGTGMILLADTDRSGLIGDAAGEWVTGDSLASQTSRDGTVIVGYAFEGPTRRPFRWDTTSGLVNLADKDKSGIVGDHIDEWAIGTGYANFVSVDGSVVSGQALDENGIYRAFRWDASKGLVNILDLDGNGEVGNSGDEFVSRASYSLDMSADGSVIIGHFASGVESQVQIFRWDVSNSLVNILDLDGNGEVGNTDAEWASNAGNSVAFAKLSDDGQRIFGRIKDKAQVDRAFVWDEGDKSLINLADTDGNRVIDPLQGEWATGASIAKLSNFDGSILFGSAHDGTKNRAFRWDSTTGMINLADFDGSGIVADIPYEWATSSSYVEGISDDGSVAIGYAFDASSYQRAYRWTSETGMVRLADTDGSGIVGDDPREWASTRSFAYSVSGDGSIVAGAAYDTGSITRAYRWDSESGMVSITDLDGSGVIGDIPEEWAVGASTARLISDDGSILIGTASDRESVSRVFLYGALEASPHVLIDADNTLAATAKALASQSTFYKQVIDGQTRFARYAWDTEITSNTSCTVEFQRPCDFPVSFRLIGASASNAGFSGGNYAGFVAAVGLNNGIDVGGYFNRQQIKHETEDSSFKGPLKSMGVFAKGSFVDLGGVTWKASYSTTSDTLDFARFTNGVGTENASGQIPIFSTTKMLELGYPVQAQGTMFTPYITFAQTSTSIDAFTEQGATFPVSYSAANQTVTTASFGVEGKSAWGGRNTVSWGVEVEHDLSRKDDGVTGSVDVSAMPTVSMSPLDVQNQTRFSVSAGLSRQLDAFSSVDIDLNASQSVYSKSTDLTFAVSYAFQL